MPKNIILLSDGTGNSASKLFKTNVWRLYQALDLSESGQTKKQIAYYDDGVGTASFKPLAILGGAFGWGLKRNVLDLYTALCRHYEQGDNIYCFGFSRGAFTIRVLIGLINNQGLVKPKGMGEGELRRLAAEAFRAYREDRYHKWFLKPFRMLRNGLIWLWYNLPPRRKPYDATKNYRDAKITFLGLWDTVAAYGLPLDELTRAWDAVFPLSFPDRNLSGIVQRACHALALDDERHSFHPELWNESEETDPQRLTQVWFAGMHTNVGGGYPDDALSHVSLEWMMAQSESVELVFRADEKARLQASADINGKMYDSRGGVGGSYRYLPRKLADLTHDSVNDPQKYVVCDLPKIHESVFRRIKDRTEGYAPIGLPGKYVVYKADGQIVNMADPEAKQLGFVEHSTQAKSRANLQEKVWNLVWWKRIVYFFSVFVFSLLAVFPLYNKPRHGWEEALGFVSNGVELVSSFLPGFLGFWIAAYQKHPGLFSLLLLLLILLISVGSKLQLRLFDRMRGLWKPAASWPVGMDSEVGLPQDKVFKFRTNPAYLWLYKAVREKLLPVVAGVAAVLILAVIVVRVVYGTADSFGCFCNQETSDKTTFNTTNPCWDSGVQVEEGKRYKITIAVDPSEEWNDGSIKHVSLRGFGRERMPALMYLGFPFRRQFTAPWFHPVARIGNLGNDEYLLSGDMPDDKTLVSVIEARHSGKLFLYVNDAVSIFPWTRYYENNKGKAKVAIEPVN
ncbi:MAG: DUF2235 domain-containing protein [Blastocatellia bacterium]